MYIICIWTLRNPWLICWRSLIRIRRLDCIGIQLKSIGDGVQVAHIDILSIEMLDWKWHFIKRPATSRIYKFWMQRTFRAPPPPWEKGTIWHEEAINNLRTSIVATERANRRLFIPTRVLHLSPRRPPCPRRVCLHVWVMGTFHTIRPNSIQKIKQCYQVLVSY